MKTEVFRFVAAIGGPGFIISGRELWTRNLSIYCSIPTISTPATGIEGLFCNGRTVRSSNWSWQSSTRSLSATSICNSKSRRPSIGTCTSPEPNTELHAVKICSHAIHDMHRKEQGLFENHGHSGLIRPQVRTPRDFHSQTMPSAKDAKWRLLSVKIWQRPKLILGARRSWP